ncbi:hypothetical protein FACS1894202_04420 [Clostridia bacterium]|nr:hypothetical protein FACS1894202_04420 [Clostridia bacterium]
MPSVEKIIEKMRNQPNGIRFIEADKVLMACGFVFERQKGSHRRYSNGTEHLTLPESNPIKAFYVREILKLAEDRSEIQ